MLYSNTTVEAEERTFDFGVIWQVALGEQGRGRKLLALTCPPGLVLNKGENLHLSIGMTRTGKPRIIVADDPNIYLLLSSSGGYTRRGDGRIYVPAIPSERVLPEPAEGYKPLAQGNGADGDAGRIGTWDVVLLAVPQDGVVKVVPSGGRAPDEFYIVRNGHVYSCTDETLHECCDALDMDMPVVERWARV